MTILSKIGMAIDDAFTREEETHNRKFSRRATYSAAFSAGMSVALLHPTWAHAIHASAAAASAASDQLANIMILSFPFDGRSGARNP